MELTDATRVRAAAGVSAQPVDDRALLVNLGSGRCFELNRIGFEMWRLLADGQPIGEAAAALSARYPAARDVLRADLLSLVGALVREGLAEVTNAFVDRYLLARFACGGVVADLETGNYFRLDARAAEVCDACARARDDGAAAAELARRLGVPDAQAAAMVADTRAALAAVPSRGTPQGSYRFAAEGSDYALWHGERRVLSVDGRTLDVRLEHAPAAAGGAPELPQLELYVRALAPKILFLRGLTVLHASAVVAGGRLLAVAGISRAGKTTTAHAFAAAGAHLTAEDLVVLVPGADVPTVAVDGEAAAHRWAAETAAALAQGARTAPSGALAAATDGARAPLGAVLFLDARRRAGSDLAVRALDPCDGLVALLENAFLGAASPREWRRFFESAAALAAAVALGEATAPLGAERLPDAARRYMSSRTS